MRHEYVVSLNTIYTYFGQFGLTGRRGSCGAVAAPLARMPILGALVLMLEVMHKSYMLK